MAASTTTFEERIARIHARAARSENTGYVKPGTAEEPIDPRANKARRQKGKTTRGGYIISVLGGVFTSVAVVAIGAVVLFNSAEGGSFEDIAASILFPED